MNELRGKGEALSSMCVTGEGLPALPKKCVDKILVGEIIDFSDVHTTGKGESEIKYPCAGGRWSRWLTC